MKPKVSIITPLFNRANLVKETWESIKNQTSPDWEWIVVDDGSTDGSYRQIEEISKTDQRLKIYNRPKELHKGPSSCRNYGVTQSKGEYLLFLDADDLLDFDCLQKRVELVTSDPCIDLAVFNIETFRKVPGDGELFNRHYDGNRHEYIQSFLSDVPAWQTSGGLWCRKTFDNLGGFNELLTCMEDPELHLRALLKNEIRVKFLEDFPADCYYRKADYSSENDASWFYNNSIKGRLAFYPQFWKEITQMNSPSTAHYQKAIQKGVIRFFKHFLISRVKKYTREYDNFLSWCDTQKVLSSYQLFILRLIRKLYLSSNPLLSPLKLRGLVYNLVR